MRAPSSVLGVAASSHVFRIVLVSVVIAMAVATGGWAQVGSHQKIGDSVGNFNGVLENLDCFGMTAGLDDLDGDSVEDLAVGASGDSDGGSHRGAVWVLFLNTDGTVKSYKKISDTEGNFDGTLDDTDSFGWHVCSLGDLDGDGESALALAVGAPNDDDGGADQSADRGAVWILFLDENGTVLFHQKISSTEGNFTGDLDDGDRFGFYVASLGDLDGAGESAVTLAVGASQDDDGGANPLADRGAVWLLFLDNAGVVLSHQKISDTEGNFTGDLGNGDLFGQSVTALGDLDGAGGSKLALAVGAPHDDDGGSNRGAVWLLFLNDDGTVLSHEKISDTEGNFTGGLDDKDDFGDSMAGVGDLDGNGTTDLVVGARRDDDGGEDQSANRGAVWLLFLDTSGSVLWHQKISDTEGNFSGTLDDRDHFSITPSSLGDLNDDGVLDLAVGAWADGGWNNDGDRRGAVWVLFLADMATSVGDRHVAARLPVGSRLVASVPNPFRSRTTIQYDLPGPGDASIRIYDVAGRLVRTLDLRGQPAGASSVDWNGKDDRGLTVASGSYVVRLVTSDSRDAMPVTVIK